MSISHHSIRKHQPIYLYNILPRDGSADPPSKGARSEKVKAQAHRTPTPPYPFLVPTPPGGVGQADEAVHPRGFR